MAEDNHNSTFTKQIREKRTQFFDNNKVVRSLDPGLPGANKVDDRSSSGSENNNSDNRDVAGDVSESPKSSNSSTAKLNSLLVQIDKLSVSKDRISKELEVCIQSKQLVKQKALKYWEKVNSQKKEIESLNNKARFHAAMNEVFLKHLTKDPHEINLLLKDASLVGETTEIASTKKVILEKIRTAPTVELEKAPELVSPTSSKSPVLETLNTALNQESLQTARDTINKYHMRQQLLKTLEELESDPNLQFMDRVMSNRNDPIDLGEAIVLRTKREKPVVRKV